MNNAKSDLIKRIKSKNGKIYELDTSDIPKSNTKIHVAVLFVDADSISIEDLKICLGDIFVCTEKLCFHEMKTTASDLNEEVDRIEKHTELINNPIADDDPEYSKYLDARIKTSPVKSFYKYVINYK